MKNEFAKLFTSPDGEHQVLFELDMNTDEEDTPYAIHMKSYHKGLSGKYQLGYKTKEELFKQWDLCTQERSDKLSPKLIELLISSCPK